MNIYLISSGYPTHKDPQYGCFERDQAKAFQRGNHKLTILYVDGRFRSYYRKIGITHFNDCGIEVYSIYWFPLYVIYAVFPKLYKLLIKKMLCTLYEFVLKREDGPNIIYAHFLTNIYAATAIKEKYNIPLVGMEHWSLLNSLQLPLFLKDMGKYAYTNANQIVAVSESLRKQINFHFNKDAVVVHNMIGEEFILAPKIPKTIGNGEKIHFISVGSLIYRKGFDVLVKALQIVMGKFSNWELKIVGDGPEKKKLLNLIVQANLSDNIKLVGRKNKNEIISLLHDSDVFIFPSRAENFSVAVLEALSAGLPVVATICGGIRECINSSNGLLVPVDDEKQMADAIIEIVESIRKYSKKLIMEDCKQKYSPAVITQQLIDIFESITDRK